MTKINLEYLEDMYDSLPTRERTRTNVERVVGSLTDNRRMVKPNRDGAHKRINFDRNSKLKWYRKVNIPGSHDAQPKWSNLEMWGRK